MKPLRTFLYDKTHALFALDTRSLALSRIFLALIVLGDLFTRSFFLRAHYGEDGVLPQAFFFNESVFGDWHWSLHLAGPSPLFPALFFVAHALFALMLLVGWKTRVAAIGTWVLTLSLQFANPLLMHGGDVLLRLALFLFIFLPIAERFSVDSVGKASAHQRALTPWTVALVLQICLFYFFTFIHKTGSEWTTEGSAVYYALSLEQFTTPFGVALYSFPLLMTVLSFAVWWIQRFSIFLILSPLWTDITRGLAIILLASLHVGFGLSLYLGTFSWVSIAVLTTLVPTRFWNFVAAKLQSRFKGITIYYDADCRFCEYSSKLIKTFFLLPNARVLPAQTDLKIAQAMKENDSWVIVTPDKSRYFAFEAGLQIARSSPLLFPLAWLGNVALVKRLGDAAYQYISHHRKYIPLPRPSRRRFSGRPFLKVSSAVIATLFVYSAVFWCLRETPALGQTLPLPSSVQWIERVLGLNQTWWIFAPFPRKDDGWYIVVGSREDGSTLDLLQDGRRINFDKPEVPSSLYPDARWRKYFINLKFDSAATVRPYFLEYMCKRWNSAHSQDKRIVQAELIYMLETSLPNYEQAPIEKLSLATITCPTEVLRVYLE